MEEGIIYPKGIVPRNEDFRAAQKMRGEVYQFLQTTMEETVESAFDSMGYKQKAQPAGFYADGNAYGYGVDDHVYNVKVGSKTNSYLEKRIGLGGKRVVCELHMTMYPESMTVEMHYKNTEDAAFRGHQEGVGGYMINEKMVVSCANMEKFKKDMTKKLKEFADKEVGFIINTKLGNEDRMEKSTASVVEGFSLKALFEDDFETSANKINEATSSLDEKEKEEDEELLLGDDKDKKEEEETTDEITTAGAGPGGAGGFGYDTPKAFANTNGEPMKRNMKTSAPYTEPVNESVDHTDFYSRLEYKGEDFWSRATFEYTTKKGGTVNLVDVDGELNTITSEDEPLGSIGVKTPAEHLDDNNYGLDEAKPKRPRIRHQANPVDEVEGFGTSMYLSHGNDFMDALVSDAGLDYMQSENPDSLAFDFMDAITVFRHDYNEDHPFLHYIGSLQQKNDYRPAMGLSYDSMSDEGKQLYDELEKAQDFYKEKEWKGMTYENNQMNEEQKKFNDTPYAKRLRENRRPTNMRIIPEGDDGFWTVVDQETLDGYKKNHIMGAPGAEGVEVNSKEEEEYNSGGVQKFPGGKAYKKKKGVNEQEDYQVLRDRQKYFATQYVKGAQTPIVVSELADSKTLIVLEGANPENPEIEEQGYKVMETAQALELLENGGYHGMLVAHHTIHQEAVAESVKKRFKHVHVTPQVELNERWKKLATFKDAESIHLAESVIPDEEAREEPKRNISESVEGLEELSRDTGLEEGDVIDGKNVIEVEKPNCLAPVYYKVFKEDYDNQGKAFIWDFNTGNLVNNPNFQVK